MRVFPPACRWTDSACARIQRSENGPSSNSSFILFTAACLSFFFNPINAIFLYFFRFSVFFNMLAQVRHHAPHLRRSLTLRPDRVFILRAVYFPHPTRTSPFILLGAAPPSSASADLRAAIGHPPLLELLQATQVRSGESEIEPASSSNDFGSNWLTLCVHEWSENSSRNID